LRAYIDSDILIWHLRGNHKALDFLQGLRNDEAYELWIGAMQRAEVVFFMRPGEEDSSLLFLSQFKTASVDQNIIDKAAAIYRQWHPSHGIDINDAILAATAIQTGGQIYCLNRKLYPMPDLLVKKAWQRES
jgi:predicted nucleic acid-binding protein